MSPRKVTTTFGITSRSFTNPIKKKPNSDCHHHFLSRTYMPYAARYSPAIKSPHLSAIKSTETAILSTKLKISI
jgi:hypothetical protein